MGLTNIANGDFNEIVEQLTKAATQVDSRTKLQHCTSPRGIVLRGG